jgi:hypothetical protein
MAPKIADTLSDSSAFSQKVHMIPTSSVLDDWLNTCYLYKQKERFGSREAEAVSLVFNWSEKTSLDEIQTERRDEEKQFNA